MYIIIRKDLTPGQKIAQATHAAFTFAQEHPDITQAWINISNYICILEIDNEPELVKLCERAIRENISVSRFVEPDLNNSLTTIALEPGIKSKKLCSNLPLAMKT